MRSMMVVGSLLWAVASSGQSVITPDLKAVPEGKGWRVKEWKFNSARAITNESTQWVESVKGKSALRFKGLAWVEGVTFSNGTIECDILGKSKGPNFIGGAFHPAAMRPGRFTVSGATGRDSPRPAPVACRCRKPAGAALDSFSILWL